MTATLRAQLPLGPKGSLLPGRTTAATTRSAAELRAERRASGLTANQSRVACGRRSISGWSATDLLGWSGALESRLVSFEDYRKEAA